MPLPDRLGREERLEQLRFVLGRHAGPIVLHFEPDLFAGVEDANEDAALLPAGRLDRLLRVDDEVQRDLLDLGEVRVDLARRRELDIERDRQVVEIAPPQLDDLGDHLAQIDERRRTRLLAAEARQVADDLAGAAALGLDEGDLLERFGPEPAVTLEQLGGAEDRLQRVVQLVRDAGHEHARPPPDVPDGRPGAAATAASRASCVPARPDGRARRAFRAGSPPS